ncbi:PepSY domain-containing protein [Pelagibius sp. Alg239-R121]|uniref:PepSY-associated TM helix domain-containing protein n=1 Tax=Pelagibius sp. Alg239-R121 TaxID=2993448 RepID=UPI0024A71899|nr:PepSY domain-containing protein [Pelagibius sp. Alg239-R121]
MSDLSSVSKTQLQSQKQYSLYRAIWRWHFYAGLIALPFMILLAVTGSLYLFKDEFNRNLYAERSVVEPQTTPPLSPDALVEAAVAAAPGSTPSNYQDPAADDASAAVTLKTEGGKFLAFVDPYSGKVLKIFARSDEFGQVVRKVHSLAFFGDSTNKIIEAVGGFAMVLVVTGIYLWWPRTQSGGVYSLRGKPASRVFWRDLHAVTGAFAGLLIFFLALSGMPWSGFWGNQLNQIANSMGAGYPEMLWDNVPTSSISTGEVLESSGWTVENAPMPLSATAGKTDQTISLQKAVEIARGLDITRGFSVALPSGPEGVYSASIYPDDLDKQRMIHIDQYSGKAIIDLKFADYGAVAKAIEWGINIHMGQEWGLVNQLIMLATCIAILLSSVAAAVMWWKRRPKGRLGVPPAPQDKRVYVGLWIIAILFGIAFPISGAAIATMLVLDFCLIRWVPPLRRAFS